MITSADLDNWFKYHPPGSEDEVAYQRLREAGRAFCEAILMETPASSDQTVAIRKVRECVLVANQARACNQGGIGASHDESEPDSPS